VLLVPLSAFSIAAVMLGQNVPLLLLGMAAGHYLVVKKRDGLAGVILAWLTVKPQLTGLLIAAVLIWSCRQRRFGILGGFLVGLFAFIAASGLVRPNWVAEMWTSLQITPLPTRDFPWIGDSWLLVLRSCRLHAWPLWTLYAVVALPAAVIAIYIALRRDWDEVVACGVLAAFWVTPYNQFYDLAVLMIPLCLLLPHLSPRLSPWVALLFLIMPHLHIALLSSLLLPWLPDYPLHKVTLFWVPVALTALWIISLSGKTGVKSA
jgi:hypothetical protein